MNRPGDLPSGRIAQLRHRSLARRRLAQRRRHDARLFFDLVLRFEFSS